MELIQALEQLSLEVRNNHNKGEGQLNERHHPLQDGVNSTTGHWDMTDSGSDNMMVVDGQMNRNHVNSTNQAISRQRQLEEFDSSVGTLFSQIQDLECVRLNNSHLRQPNYGALHAASVRRSQFASGHLFHSQENDKLGLHRDLQPNRHRSEGNVDTSLEHGSDWSCSIGAHGWATASSGQVEPLVRDLINKRDLSSITESVRRIGQILALGSQLEKIHELRQAGVGAQLSSEQVRSICDTFNGLCFSELESVRRLPTIRHYRECSKKVLSYLHDKQPDCHASAMPALNSSSSSSSTFSSSSSNSSVSSISSQISTKGSKNDTMEFDCDGRRIGNVSNNNHQQGIQLMPHEDEDDVEGEEELSFLDSCAGNPNWTNNKLYMGD